MIKEQIKSNSVINSRKKLRTASMTVNFTGSYKNIVGSNSNITVVGKMHSFLIRKWPIRQ